MQLSPALHRHSTRPDLRLRTARAEPQLALQRAQEAGRRALFRAAHRAAAPARALAADLLREADALGVARDVVARGVLAGLGGGGVERGGAVGSDGLGGAGGLVLRVAGVAVAMLGDGALGELRVFSGLGGVGGGGDAVEEAEAWAGVGGVADEVGHAAGDHAVSVGAGVRVVGGCSGKRDGWTFKDADGGSCARLVVKVWVVRERHLGRAVTSVLLPRASSTRNGHSDRQNNERILNVVPAVSAAARSLCMVFSETEC